MEQGHRLRMGDIKGKKMRVKEKKEEGERNEDKDREKGKEQGGWHNRTKKIAKKRRLAKNEQNSSTNSIKANKEEQFKKIKNKRIKKKLQLLSRGLYTIYIGG